MAKRIYVGVDGIARKVKKAYIGVEGLARKVKKAYIGVGGVARPVFSGGELVHYGSSEDGAVEALSARGCDSSAAIAGSCAIFSPSNTHTNSPSGLWDVFDSSLTHRTMEAKTNGSNAIDRGSVSFGEYAMFGGGRISAYGNVATVDVFDVNLTRSTYSIRQRINPPATTVGEYALFGPGRRLSSSGDTSVKYVEAFNRNFTIVDVTGSSQVMSAKGAHVEGHALFASYSAAFEAYDESLTKITLDTLRTCSTAETGGFALFQWESPARVSAFDASLTRRDIDILVPSRLNTANTSTGDYAIFASGSYVNVDGNYCTDVDVYDSSLVHSKVSDLATPACKGTAVCNGNYVLVGGGEIKPSNLTSTSSTYYYTNDITVYSV